MRYPYQPKRFLQEIINDGLAELGVGGPDVVTAVGYFGEKGVVFFGQSGAEDDEYGAKVGFTLVGRDIDAKHYNLSRDSARNLVKLLIEQYHFNVNVTHTPEQVIPASTDVDVS